MKKVLATVLTAAVLCGVCATGAWAAGHHGGWNTAADRVCAWADGSGESYTCRAGTDGDGVCDSCGTGRTCRQDADGNGVCDLCGAACGTGMYSRHGRGAGHCGR